MDGKINKGFDEESQNLNFHGRVGQLDASGIPKPCNLFETKTELSTQEKKMRNEKWRNLLGFWLLGLTNNYAYVIMLSAAHDILSKGYNNDQIFSSEKNQTKFLIEDNNEICNDLSTGVILLLDVFPSLLMKILAPFISGYTGIKIFINVLFQALSFLLTGFAFNSTMAYIGIVLASLAAGLGESTILGYSSRFESNIISTWSSGTGAAGFLGSLTYLFLTSIIGLSPKASILLMLVMPAIMFFTFFILIVPPSELTDPLIQSNSETIATNETRELSNAEKFIIFKKLVKYIIPISLVFYFEYFINQGLVELIKFKSAPFDFSGQYRFYQADYQLGVLISRSSVNLFRIRKLWILPILQGLNVILLLSHILYPFLPSLWFVAAIVLFEGLLGGWSYVNTFIELKDTEEFTQKEKEFTMPATAIGDSVGITVAGFTSIPTHNILCAYMKKHY